MTTECTACTVLTTNADGICRFCADYTPPQLPHPAGAETVGEWRNTDSSDETIPPFRDFTGRTWTVPAAHDTSGGWELGSGDTTVTVEGAQFATGQIRRWVEISGDTTLLPPESLGVLADMLLMARTEILRLNAGETYSQRNAPIFSEAAIAR